MGSFMSLALSVAVLASFLLIGFGIAGLLRRTMPPVRAWLMLGAGVITLLNVVVLSLPGAAC
jgi:hypothetical protein